jgi:hypothetical protein
MCGDFVVLWREKWPCLFFRLKLQIFAQLARVGVPNLRVSISTNGNYN